MSVYGNLVDDYKNLLDDEYVTQTDLAGYVTTDQLSSYVTSSSLSSMLSSYVTSSTYNSHITNYNSLLSRVATLEENSGLDLYIKTGSSSDFSTGFESGSIYQVEHEFTLLYVSSVSSTGATNNVNYARWYWQNATDMDNCYSFTWIFPALNTTWSTFTASSSTVVRGSYDVQVNGITSTYSSWFNIYFPNIPTSSLSVASNSYYLSGTYAQPASIGFVMLIVAFNS